MRNKILLLSIFLVLLIPSVSGAWITGYITNTFDVSGTPVMGDWNGTSGRTNIGVYSNGTWSVDLNGNGVWDGTAGGDFTNAPLGGFGVAGDIPVTGDWNGDGTTKIGVYSNGTWFVDWNGSGAWDGEPTDKTATFGFAGATPVTGDWNDCGFTTVGVYKNGTWYLDWDCDRAWNSTNDQTATFGFAGAIPVTGDWNEDGTTKIGVYSNGTWYLDVNGNGEWDPTNPDIPDQTINFGFPGATPVTGQVSGHTAIGVYYNEGWIFVKISDICSGCVL